MTGLDIAAGGNELRFTGDLVNAGTLMMCPLGSTQQSSAIRALDIFHLRGASITSIVSCALLSLNAANQIANLGTISSAGDLSYAEPLSRKIADCPAGAADAGFAPAAVAYLTDNCRAVPTDSTPPHTNQNSDGHRGDGGDRDRDKHQAQHRLQPCTA